MSNRKRRAYKKARKTQNQRDWERFKQLQKDNRNLCKAAYSTYVNNMISDDKTKKKLFAFIKSKKADGSGVSALRSDGLLHSSAKEKAHILNTQFSSVFTRENMENLPDLEASPYDPIANIEINANGVRKLMEGLNPNKASGPDKISARFLKSMAEPLAPALTTLFQASLSQGRIPQDWKSAFVTPIFKKGDKAKPSNYRPVSLTSTCCKLLEHIIHSHIINHLDNNKILTDAQHGFRKKRSCDSQLINTVHDLAKGLDSRQQIDAVLLDFSKAFDKVAHQRLLQKLSYYGIKGKTLEWIESFLSNRTQRVVVEGEQSKPAPVTSGVPQGSVLGPLLFLVYINDLPSQVLSQTRLFADDCLLYRTINNADDTIALQKDLDALQHWEQKWQMHFNPDKCEVIRITNKRKIVNANYTIHGQELGFTEKAKYLGVTIDPKLSWNHHINSVKTKANNTLAFLRRNLADCPKNIRKQSYLTLVRPQLEYASTVWDNSNKTQQTSIEAVQRRAARYITKDFRRTSSVSSMLQQLELESLRNRRLKARAIMIYRIVKGLVDITTTPLVPAGTSTRGHSMRFLQPGCNLKSYQDSFFPASITIWNTLPSDIVKAETLEQFKNGLSKLNLE